MLHIFNMNSEIGGVCAVLSIEEVVIFLNLKSEQLNRCFSLIMQKQAIVLPL